MFRRFLNLLAETWILDLAAGIALGFAFVDFARSIFSGVIQFWTQKQDEGEISDFLGTGLGSLTFEIDGRPVYLAPIVETGLTLLAVTGVVLLVVQALSRLEDAE